MPNSQLSGERRALVVEDQTTFRELLAELLEARGFQVESCATGHDARERLSNAHYQLLLLDLVLPDGHGLDILADLGSFGGAARRRSDETRVVVLTGHARPAVVKDALSRGAHGVVTKGAPLRELRDAIERVSTGGVYYSTETSKLLREAAVQPERDEQLTERQREILRHVARGLSSKEIAVALGLSEKTVANHRARIMLRIGVHDVAGLTRHAIALGLVDPDL
jgi:DNA-binding NarL/FixJ family response regulator